MAGYRGGGPDVATAHAPTAGDRSTPRSDMGLQVEENFLPPANPTRARLTLRRTNFRSPPRIRPNENSFVPTRATRSDGRPTQIPNPYPTQTAAPNPCRRPDSQPKFSATSGVKDRRRRPASAGGRRPSFTPDGGENTLQERVGGKPQPQEHGTPQRVATISPPRTLRSLCSTLPRDL